MSTKTKKKSVAEYEMIVCYKGFDANWRCRGHQFGIGGTYIHEGKVRACESGFHACEYPLDVFVYYPPAGSQFAIVKQSGDLSRNCDDTKVASRIITISEKIDIAGLVKASIEYTIRRCNPIDPNSPASATGYRGAASATGDRGAASATGKASVAIASGCEGRAQAADGCAIVLVFRDDDDNIVHIRASKVGENGIKPNIWYTLDADGDFVEIGNDGDRE